MLIKIYLYQQLHPYRLDTIFGQKKELISHAFEFSDEKFLEEKYSGEGDIMIFHLFTFCIITCQQSIFKFKT